MITNAKKIFMNYNNKNLALTALCLGFFMVIMDVNIVNIVLPTITIELSVGLSWLQWIADGYTLTFACFLLSAGYLGDRLGAKNIYLLGLLLFILTSFACGIAVNVWSLTIFRLLQGVSAALLVPSSLTLIKNSYENKADRAKAIAIWASVGGVAAASAPVAGAICAAMNGWRTVFLINIPLGVIGIFLTINYINNKIEDNVDSFDLPGQIMGMISIASLAFVLIEMGRLGYQSSIVLSTACLFLFAFISFIIIEYRTLSPMFPLMFFRSKTFSISIMVGMIINLCGYGVLFLLPLYFQNVKMYSVLMSGLAITPFSALAALGSYFSGKITNLLGPKIVMIVGLSTASIGFFMMLITGDKTSYSWLLLPLILVGVGGAITMPSATIAVINSAPESKTGVVSGIFNTSRQVGSLIGVAIFGTIVSRSGSFIYGMHSVLIIAGTISLLGCLATVVWVDV